MKLFMHYAATDLLLPTLSFLLQVVSRQHEQRRVRLRGTALRLTRSRLSSINALAAKFFRLAVLSNTDGKQITIACVRMRRQNAKTKCECPIHRACKVNGPIMERIQ